MPAPTPPKNTDAAATGLLPQLYQHAIGPLATAYYQRIFAHFETLGRTPARWNHAAAFCTLGWCLLRGLWRPAGLYGATALAIAALWRLEALRSLPLQAQASLGLLATIGLCCVPGFLGNGWYYRLVHRHTIAALEQSPTLAQAAAVLQRQASNRRQWALAAIGQIALWVLLATLVAMPTAPSTAPAQAQVGPPQLHFPTRGAEATESAAQPSSSSTDTLQASPAALPDPAAPTAIAAVTPPPSTPMEQVEPIEPAPPAEEDAPIAPVPVPAAPAPAAVPATPTSTPPPAPRPSTAATATARIAPPASKASTPGRFFVSIGTYAELTNAAAAEKRVRQAGLPVVSFSSTTNKGTLTRLRAGPFNTRAEAERAQRLLQAQRLPAKVLELRP